jgi:hypothetical protein
MDNPQSTDDNQNDIICTHQAQINSIDGFSWRIDKADGNRSWQDRQQVSDLHLSSHSVAYRVTSGDGAESQGNIATYR